MAFYPQRRLAMPLLAFGEMLRCCGKMSAEMLRQSMTTECFAHRNAPAGDTAEYIVVIPLVSILGKGYALIAGQRR